jgi:hypothetical protein
MVGHDVLLNFPDTNAELIDVIDNQGTPSADRTSGMHESGSALIERFTR